MEIKEDIKRLHEIRERITSLVNFHQWVSARDFREAYEGVERTIAALEKISEDLHSQHENQNNYLQTDSQSEEL